MLYWTPLWIGACVLVAAVAGFASPQLGGQNVHQGMADASAMVLVGTKHLLVANDEDNALRLFRVDAGGPPVSQFPMDNFLKVDPNQPEVDIEAAARIADRVYWISSHGRNKSGKKRESRLRFFATTVYEVNSEVRVAPVGKPFDDLEKLLTNSRSLVQQRLNLDAVKKIAPKKGGLNIEGLAPTPEGGLLIGFRSPLIHVLGSGQPERLTKPADEPDPDQTPDTGDDVDDDDDNAPSKQFEGRAIVLPLLNPAAIIQGGHDPQLGEPILLNLDNLGIRALDYCPRRKTYFILAGPVGNGPPYKLFQWAGPASRSDPVLLMTVDLGPNAAPEAICVFPDRDDLLIVSDEGSRLVNGVPNKQLPNPADRTFRSVWITGLSENP